MFLKWLRDDGVFVQQRNDGPITRAGSVYPGTPVSSISLSPHQVRLSASAEVPNVDPEVVIGFWQLAA